MILARSPVLEQIAIMHASRIARFARHIRDHRPVPIAEIENLPVGRAAGLQSGTAGRVDREPVARPRQWTAMPLRRFQWMREVDLVQPPPLPALHVRTPL